MARYKKTTRGSFFGDFLLEYAAPEGDFLLDLREVIDWGAFRPALLAAYRGKGEKGEAPYDPIMVLKMLFLSYTWNISERRVECLCRRDMVARAFLGVSGMDPIPDHSTLSLFRTRLQEHSGEEAYSAIFDAIIRQAVALGVKLGPIQLVDSVHTAANVDAAKDREREERGEPSSDPDATIVQKGRRRVTNADGQVEQKEIVHLGYKTHVSMDAESGLVTSIKPTSGSSSDSKQMAGLIAHDGDVGVPGEIYAGDKAYDDGDIMALLDSLAKRPAIRLRSFRTARSNPHAARWLAMVSDECYQAGCAVRYRIERKFAEAKLWHGFGRCRYRGLLRYKAQAYLTFMALNLKRIVYLLTGRRPTEVPAR